jgi:hypothetical protein
MRFDGPALRDTGCKGTRQLFGLLRGGTWRPVLSHGFFYTRGLSICHVLGVMIYSNSTPITKYTRESSEGIETFSVPVDPAAGSIPAACLKDTPTLKGIETATKTGETPHTRHQIRLAVAYNTGYRLYACACILAL